MTNAWHIEAQNLSASAHYVMRSELSAHTFEIEASRCSGAPPLFRYAISMVAHRLAHEMVKKLESTELLG